MHALGRLIEEERTRQELSLEAVARRGGIAKGTVSALTRADRALQMTPRPKTLEGIARGLGISLATVKAAAAESVGIPVDSRPVGYGLDREAEGLSEDAVDAVRAQIRALRKAQGLQ